MCAGEVQLWIDDQPVGPGHAQQRCVLAVDAGRLVPIDQLIDRVWGDRAPGDARGVLYNYLSRLRRALATSENMNIQRRPGGYVLAVDRSWISNQTPGTGVRMFNSSGVAFITPPAFSADAAGSWAPIFSVIVC